LVVNRNPCLDKPAKGWLSEGVSNAGQFIIMGVPGPELDAATRHLIERVQPGGFILFGRNIKSPEQLRALTDSLRSLVKQEPIITIDQEGGRVSRLKEIGSEPPSAKELRDRGDLPLIRRHGKLTGQLLRLFGFNLDLCPVLDVSFDDEADNSLKNRTYGKTPEQVIANASEFTEGLRGEGILSCGKHFPGYSAAGLDPHHELPKIERSRRDLESCEWVPFRTLMPVCDSFMIGHAVYPDLDKEAASLSEKIITGVLRREWGYDGLVMTDDLDMGAILNHYGFEESIRLSLEAGNDAILLCHRVEMAEKAAEVMAGLPDRVLHEAARRIENFRKRLAPPAPFSMQKFGELDRGVMQLRVDTLGEEGAVRRSMDDGKRSPVETF
jgi:beta-N-acetylhexosaminidase